MLAFDIETDGLLEEVEVVHCINVIDRTTGKREAYNSGRYKDGSPAPRTGSIEEGLKRLEEADCIAGVNIIEYDIPALKKLYPKFNPKGKVIDTIPLTKVIYPNIKDIDFALIRKGRLPHEFQQKGLIGKHSLEAWGWRLGEYKGDFSPKNYTNPETGKPHTWKTIGFTKEMDEYCRQDVEVAVKLLEKIESKNYPQECIDLELRVAQIIFKQVERGFAVDVDAINKLAASLMARRAEIEAQLREVFPPWYAPDIRKGTCEFTPKGRNEKLGYEPGATFSRVKLVIFNPGSRLHVADRLGRLYGWEPLEFTPSGEPKVDEEILGAMVWPEAKLLNEYFLVQKTLGQIAEGNNAWLKHVRRTGLYGKEGPIDRIHGRVNTGGTVTGRMSHHEPNIAQTPKVLTGKDGPLLGLDGRFGYECRSCFVASPGMVLVGCDAEGLELRMLAHYMARWDGGEYAEAIVNGRKEDETDVHNVNKRAWGMNSRDNSKTATYALLYGAGDYKIGTIIYDDFTEEQKERFNRKFPLHKKQARSRAIAKLGRARKQRILQQLPALGKLVEEIRKTVKKKGYLTGLDGRRLHVRSEHSALNTLLQSGGAIVMKKALVLLDDALAASNRFDSENFFFVANIHDEFQMEVVPELSDEVGQLAADSIRRAGEHFNLRCPLAGKYDKGLNWAETH